MRKLRQNLVGHVKLRDGPVKIAKDDGAKITLGRFLGCDWVAHNFKINPLQVQDG